jgi:ribose/xylose/arabinose/galactoside ABC-type transport system permease subunit
MPRLLLLVLAGEIILFSTIGENFLTLANLVEVVRLSVEVGLIAIALTPVLVTGGIDLSVGSMLGLAAVVFGAVFHEWHLPIAAAVFAALVVGAAGGALNAALVARLGIP